MSTSWNWKDTGADAAISFGSGMFAADRAAREADKARGANFDLTWQMQIDNQQFAREQWAEQQKENRWAWSAQQKADTRKWNQQKQETRYWADHGKSHEVESLRRAGLNPVLAAGAFGSARAASMPAPTSPNPRGVPGRGSSGGGSMASAQQNFRMVSDYSQLQLLREQAKKLRSETAINDAVKKGVDLTNVGKNMSNSAQALKLDLDKLKAEFRTGKHAWFFKNILLPAQDYKSTFNPLEGAHQNFTRPTINGQ